MRAPPLQPPPPPPPPSASAYSTHARCIQWARGAPRAGGRADHGALVARGCTPSTPLASPSRRIPPPAAHLQIIDPPPFPSPRRARSQLALSQDTRRHDDPAPLPPPPLVPIATVAGCEHGTRRILHPRVRGRAMGASPSRRPSERGVQASARGAKRGGVPASLPSLLLPPAPFPLFRSSLAAPSIPHPAPALRIPRAYAYAHAPRRPPSSSLVLLPAPLPKPTPASRNALRSAILTACAPLGWIASARWMDRFRVRSLYDRCIGGSALGDAAEAPRLRAVHVARGPTPAARRRMARVVHLPA
ncbi:hypothetical protein DFH09DRAFT_1369598 [Mycena vulgaris]|nr:hypothetical protein DFH09DRAFT_1369598 [Mycena vulgaris]